MKLFKIIGLSFAALIGVLCSIPLILLLIVEWTLGMIGHGFVQAGNKVERFTNKALELYGIIAQKIKEGWDSV